MQNLKVAAAPWRHLCVVSDLDIASSLADEEADIRSQSGHSSECQLHGSNLVDGEKTGHGVAGFPIEIRGYGTAEKGLVIERWD